ncbi:MAG: DUF2179 domain-containing protein [Candidatus Diapherotrites archaeon]|nr:DUF2179 domain-containing protein [Candidatus Micrarchaeota archaeon]MBU1939417.1 DUF2179 domain-containing protein [Candidatus Micrarchaeota archaeon]
MVPVDFISPDIFAYVVLPILIFIARILDVSLGTVRMIFIARGIKYLAPIIGFFEIMIWLLAIGQIMNNLTNPITYIAYALGFSAGTFIGILLEEKLSLGKVVVQIVARRRVPEMIAHLNEEGFRVTSVNAEGLKGRVKFIFTVTGRKKVRRIVHIIESYNPEAFYSIEDVRSVSEGVIVHKKRKGFADYLQIFSHLRKGK